MHLDTLRLLEQCLKAQHLSVGDPQFPQLAAASTKALKDLEEAIFLAEDEQASSTA